MKFLNDVKNQILSMVDKNLDLFIDHYPHVSTNLLYKPEKNALWTASFFPGMCFLAYDITGDQKYLKHSEAYLDSFEQRLDDKVHISHDLGFEFTLSCVANYKLTGNQRAYDLAMRASDMLVERYHEKGKYIQAWGPIGSVYPDVKIIIDTMMNLPLLYWTGQDEKVQIARNHAQTSSHTLIRPDFTSFHTYLMNPETGEAVCGKTHQGNRDASVWARGQAWAIYGYALSYKYTKDPWFLTVSKETANVFMAHLPADFVAYWDFDFTDQNPDIRDTSAAAIAACGLLELSSHMTEQEAQPYLAAADAIIRSLAENYLNQDLKAYSGVLTEGVYHRNDGARECVIWGDYFYFEAIVRLLKDWNHFW